MMTVPKAQCNSLRLPCRGSLQSRGCSILGLRPLHRAHVLNVHTVSHAIPQSMPSSQPPNLSEYCDIFDIPSCAPSRVTPVESPLPLYADHLAMDPSIESGSSTDEDQSTAGALWEDAGPVRQALHQDAGLNQQLISSGSTVSQLYDQVCANTAILARLGRE